jgi:dTDP-4-dehydrorhamnose reductase
MKIFLTGKNGQVGSKLEEDLKKSHEIISTDRISLDLIGTQHIKNTILLIKPDLIINAAAYTNVDQAEKEKDLAYRVNALAPKALTQVSKALDIPIIHISTDYIFDGTKEGAYEEDDQANPQSVYGVTKWQGEEFVRKYRKHFILRTSWVFSSKGNNFLKSIFKLAQEQTSLSVVDDLWGSPTSAQTLSMAIQAIIQYLNKNKNAEVYGTYHVASNGATNWYLYACKILDILESFKIKLKLKKDYLYPISSNQYPQDAIRPKNSKLITNKFEKIFMVKFPHWEEQVSFNLRQINNKKLKTLPTLF